jgi:hypothetical protein
MCALMCYKISAMTECFIAHITDIRVVTAMYTLMLYKTAPMTEHFIT